MNELNKPSYYEIDSIGETALGYISVAEVSKNIPFDIKRVYWTYFTPNNVMRGQHAHKDLEQIIFAVTGEIKFNTEDRYGNKEEFILNNPSKGLYLPPLVWRDIKFSHSAVLLCLASLAYDENDYFREYSQFEEFRNGQL